MVQHSCSSSSYHAYVSSSREEEWGGAQFLHLRAIPRNCTYHFYLHSIGQNSVIWLDTLQGRRENVDIYLFTHDDLGTERESEGVETEGEGAGSERCE